MLFSSLQDNNNTQCNNNDSTKLSSSFRRSTVVADVDTVEVYRENYTPYHLGSELAKPLDGRQSDNSMFTGSCRFAWEEIRAADLQPVMPVSSGYALFI